MDSSWWNIKYRTYFNIEAKVFFFSSFDSTTIICLKPNGIVSLLVAAAVAILALTAVKIPQDITRKGIFFLPLLSGR